jgi:hypothetical protein
MPERQFEDDPTIADDDVLFRRIPLMWLVPGDEGRKRVSSAAYKHFELSVLIEALMRAAGRRPDDALPDSPLACLVSITAGLARLHNQKVVTDNAPPQDSAHGLVVGKKTGAVAKTLARESKWVIPPEPPPID